MGYLLDTNIVTAILKDNQLALNRLILVRKSRAGIYISFITYYETKRGLLHLDAKRQLLKFERFCSTIEVLLLNDLELIEIAAKIHADLRRRGRPIQDADIFIAATAIANHLTVVSNDADLKNIQTLSLENWL
jgi:tRNA(fMet)-specific endonuclease VapC